MKDLAAIGILEGTAQSFCLKAVHLSQVAMVSVRFQRDRFDSYRCDNDLSVGLELKSLSKMLGCAGDDGSITITSGHDEDRIKFLFEGQHQPNQEPKKKSEMVLKLVDRDLATVRVPQYNQSATVKLPSAEFQRICKVLAPIGECVEISVTTNLVEFSAAGESGSAKITLAHGADNRVEICCDTSISLTFALRYLNSFAKALTLSKMTCLTLANGSPMTVLYEIEEIGDMCFVLAPKLENVTAWE